MKTLLLVSFTVLAISLPVKAQRPPQVPQAPPCVPAYTIPINHENMFIMFDTDGDRWVRIRNLGTGEEFLGFFEKKSGNWCPRVIGQKKNSET